MPETKLYEYTVDEETADPPPNGHPPSAPDKSISFSALDDSMAPSHAPLLPRSGNYMNALYIINNTSNEI